MPSTSASRLSGSGPRPARGQVALHLREARHHAGGLRERPPVERAAEEQGGDEAVAGDVAVEPDQVPGLLAAEQRALPPERLEHVAVADVGGVDADPALVHQAVEAEVRHHGDRDRLDAEVEREHGDDLVAVDRLAALVDGEHAVAVAVEGDAEVVGAVADDLR